MQHKRLRASSGGIGIGIGIGRENPWSEVMIRQEQGPLRLVKPAAEAAVALLGSPKFPARDDHRRPPRIKFTTTSPDPLTARPMPGKNAAGGIDRPSRSSGSENSRPRRADPKRKKAEAASDSSVVTTAEGEEIGVEESLVALDLLARCALQMREYEGSETSGGGSGTRQVFIRGLGITIFQRRVEHRRAAARADLLPPPPQEQILPPSGTARSRSKRKRELPSKFQDSVLLIKKQKQKKKSGTRSCR